MSDASEALQAAIYAALTEPGTVDAPVFDHVPQQQTKPYIIIGDADAEDWGTSDSNGQEFRLTITACSDKRRGRSAVKALQAQIYQRLHHANDLIAPGFQLILIHWLDGDSARDADGVTYEANARYRVLVEG